MAASSFRDGAVVGLCLMAMVVVGSIGAQAQLSPTFYNDSCPLIYDIVKAEVQKAVADEARMAASLVRLHFHDCFVNGCDGSILLNSTPGTNDSEQFALANNNSIRGLNVIDSIKAQLEAVCPQTVSCADIVALASQDAAVEAGLTPGYAVLFGRRDSLNYSQADANTFLPSPFSTYAELNASFAAVDLDEVDLVALSGAHTIGRVHCPIVLATSNDTNLGFNSTFQQSNKDSCSVPDPENTLLNLDHTTPDTFDNWYYKNLLVGEGILQSDQVLWSTAGSINQPLVTNYASDPAAFALQFAISTIKMGNFKPLTGDQGEIRLHCAFVNNQTLSSSLGSAESLVASQ